MCGIAGFLGRYRPETLAQLSTHLAHRGPDGSGVWQDRTAGVGLVHRRLSIIDLTRAANQPMSGVDGRYLVVFNGEIYNYKPLAEELAGEYSLNVNSDTAVLAPLYDKYGLAMLDKLEGIFSFALWDRENRELLLVRDHLGIKPLYYAETPEGIVFASELKALVNFWGVDLSVDPHALADYLTYLWSPGERTPVKGIKKLLPGHWLCAKLNASGRGVSFQIGRWYMPPLAKKTRGGDAYDVHKTPAMLQQLLDDVVAEQCTSDVPVGAFLSGGLDSSSLVASMVYNARAGRGPMPAMTYCIGFDGQGMAGEGFADDLPYAENVAKELGVPFSAIRIQPRDVWEALPSLATMLDEPTADPAPIFVHKIAQQARQDGIKVLLSGTGGDELMTGFRRHATASLRGRLGLLRYPAAFGLAAASRYTSGVRHRRLSKLAKLLRGSDNQFLLNSFMTNSFGDAWQLLNADWRAEIASGHTNALHVALDECRHEDLLNRLLYLELFGFLPDHNLNYTDKASMAAGVEVRVPLTDRRLMAFMSAVPPKNKLHRTRLKSFFKDSMIGRLPLDVIEREKTGFGAPLRQWFDAENGDPEGCQLIENALFSPEAAEWFDERALKVLWEQTRHGKIDGAYTVLAVAMAVWWRQGLGR